MWELPDNMCHRHTNHQSQGRFSLQPSLIFNSFLTGSLQPWILSLLWTGSWIFTEEQQYENKNTSECLLNAVDLIHSLQQPCRWSHCYLYFADEEPENTGTCRVENERPGIQATLSDSKVHGLVLNRMILSMGSWDSLLGMVSWLHSY